MILDLIIKTIEYIMSTENTENTENNEPTNTPTFETEKEYYKNNLAIINAKITSLKQEYQKQLQIAEQLDTLNETNDDKLKEIQDFLNDNQTQITDLSTTIEALDNNLRTVVESNKQKQEDFNNHDNKYNDLINSETAVNLTNKIINIRMTIDNLTNFLQNLGE